MCSTGYMKFSHKKDGDLKPLCLFVFVLAVNILNIHWSVYIGTSNMH